MPEPPRQLPQACSVARTLAGVGSYGIARSLAVLALEESVKARTLGAIAAVAAQGSRPGFSDDDLRRIVYSGHRERHAAGLIQHVAAAFPDVYGRVMLGGRDSAGEAVGIGELVGVLTEANSWKQAGFYSDFDPDSGEVVVPWQHHGRGVREDPRANWRLRDRDAATARRVHEVSSGGTGTGRVMTALRSIKGTLARP